jgi:hypothetical protein
VRAVDGLLRLIQSSTGQMFLSLTGQVIKQFG